MALIARPVILTRMSLPSGMNKAHQFTLHPKQKLGLASKGCWACKLNVSATPLVVDSQQVVLGETESTDGCLIFNAAMGSMEVVSMRPVMEACGSLV